MGFVPDLCTHSLNADTAVICIQTHSPADKNRELADS
jgi:hypothetical protein